MNLLLDMKTIFISLMIGHLFSAVLISAYWRNHTKDKTVIAFFFAKCVQAIACFFLVIRDGIPDALTMSIVNTLLFLGASFEMIAVLDLQNALYRVTKKIYIVLTATNIFGLHLIILFYHEENVRIAFVSLGIAALLILPAYRMVRERSASLLMKTTGCFYLLIIIILFKRAVVALVSSHMTSIFIPGVHQTVSFLALYLAMISGNTGFVLLMKERTDQELLRLASYDDLTGTLNRRTFISCAKKYLAAYAKEKKPISLLIFDVDQFKAINDTYGHDTGDRVLHDLSERIKRYLGAGDLFARYGGDEFAILLPGSDETESTEIAERIRQMVDGSVIQGMLLTYTISLGVLTVHPDQHTQLETLYTSCDKALYSAKNNGRNGVFRSYIDEHGMHP